MRVAYEAVDALAAEWDVQQYGQDCALVFDRDQEWLVGCADVAASDGFRSTEDSFGGAPILWKSPSVYLLNSRPQGLEQSYPFDAWKMQVGGVVSYTQNEQSRPVLMLQDWEQLHSTHPQFGDVAVDEWIGIFVHEAFHARQMWHPRLRAMLHATGADAAGAVSMADYYVAAGVGPTKLSALYDADAEVRAAVQREYALLQRATDDRALTSVAAKATLARWLALYDTRSKMVAKRLANDHAVAADAFETFLEGTARYVEARTRIAPPADADTLLGADPTYRRFAASRGQPPSKIDGLGLGNDYYYAIGMQLAFVLDVADPTWKKHVFDTDGLLIDEVRRTGTSAATR